LIESVVLTPIENKASALHIDVEGRLYDLLATATGQKPTFAAGEYVEGGSGGGT
jgi:hypothetical protein